MQTSEPSNTSSSKHTREGLAPATALSFPINFVRARARRELIETEPILFRIVCLVVFTEAAGVSETSGRTEGHAAKVVFNALQSRIAGAVAGGVGQDGTRAGRAYYLPTLCCA